MLAQYVLAMSVHVLWYLFLIANLIMAKIEWEMGNLPILSIKGAKLYRSADSSGAASHYYLSKNSIQFQKTAYSALCLQPPAILGKVSVIRLVGS